MNAPAPRPTAARLSEVSPAYRVAVEALNLAADLGCSGDLYDALWALCEREAKAYEATQEGRAC